MLHTLHPSKTLSDAYDDDDDDDDDARETNVLSVSLRIAYALYIFPSA